MRIIVLVIATLAYLPLPASAQGTSAEVAMVIEDLVAANRILAAQGILPGYGHVTYLELETETLGSTFDRAWDLWKRQLSSEGR